MTGVSGKSGRFRMAIKLDVTRLLGFERAASGTTTGDQKRPGAKVGPVKKAPGAKIGADKRPGAKIGILKKPHGAKIGASKKL
jgi:hypothetical protein